MTPSLLHQLLYGLAVFLMALLAHLPRWISYGAASRLGDLAYLCLRERRRITLENLALAFEAEKTVEEQQRIARTTFRYLGHHVVDCSRLRWITPETLDDLYTVEGFDYIETLLERQAGLLLLSAHFGSWELAAALALRLSTALHVIIRPPDHPVVRRLVAVHRQRCGFHTIPKRQALPASLEALRRREAVAVLMDQNAMRRDGMPVEFFGIKAYTTTGPALLALRARCPVVAAFLVREGYGHHRLLVTPEIPIQRTGKLRQDIEANTRAFNRVIETYVRRYPDHWFWLHRRWKQR